MCPRIPKVKEYSFSRICTTCKVEKGIDCCFGGPTAPRCKKCKGDVRRNKAISELNGRIKYLTKFIAFCMFIDTNYSLLDFLAICPEL